MRAVLVLEMYSSSSFKLESMSIFGAEVLPVFFLQQTRRSHHRLKEEAIPQTEIVREW